MKKTEKYNIETSIFEKIRRVDENGVEYWMARELGKALDYSDFGNFTNVINKAEVACKNSGQNISDHLGDVTEMIELSNN